MNSHLYERLNALDRKLVAEGNFPPLSPFWRETFQAFLNGDYRQLVARVGRQGGKSTSTCKLLVAVALFGEFKITPGTVGTVAIVSANREQSADRIRTIAKILDVLGVRYSKRTDAIALRDRPIEFRVYSATISGVSGMSCVAACADELSKWHDKESGSNPADEVLASLRPTMVTHPKSIMVLISSPMANLDAHYEAFEEGNTETQLTAQASTWIANPTVTEARTHELEPKHSKWLREFAAIPQSAVAAAFDPAAIERAFTPREPYETRAQRVLVVDPSSGKKDAWTYAVVGWDIGPDPYIRDENGFPKRSRITGDKLLNPKVTAQPPILRFDEVGALGEGTFWQSTGADEVVRRAAAIARKHGITHVHSDQREEYALKAMFEAQGLHFDSHAYTASSKPPAVEQLRRWLADGTLALPDNEALKRELYSFEESITASGAVTFKARRSGHDDFVSLLITAAMADVKGGLPQSPFRKKVFRGVINSPLSF